MPTPKPSERAWPQCPLILEFQPSEPWNKRPSLWASAHVSTIVEGLGHLEGKNVGRLTYDLETLSLQASVSFSLHWRLKQLLLTGL